MTITSRLLSQCLLSGVFVQYYVLFLFIRYFFHLIFFTVSIFIYSFSITLSTASLACLVKLTVGASEFNKYD